jgi:hypothetical protein
MATILSSLLKSFNSVKRMIWKQNNNQFVVFNLGYVRENILHQSKRNTGTAWTLNQLWSSHSRRFVPELRCWVPETRVRSLINNWQNIWSYKFAFLNYLCSFINFYDIKNWTAWVRERTIPTERPPLVGEVSATWSAWRIPTAVYSVP